MRPIEILVPPYHRQLMVMIHCICQQDASPLRGQASVPPLRMNVTPLYIWAVHNSILTYLNGSLRSRLIMCNVPLYCSRKHVETMRDCWAGAWHCNTTKCVCLTEKKCTTAMQMPWAEQCRTKSLHPSHWLEGEGVLWSDTVTIVCMCVLVYVVPDLCRQSCTHLH